MPTPQMTRHKTMSDFESSVLSDAVIELTAPNGTSYRFAYAATIPYAACDYVVLMELEPDEKGEEQLLITRLETGDDGALSFVVVEEEDIVTAVFEKYVAQSFADAMAEVDEHDCGCDHHTH